MDQPSLLVIGAGAGGLAAALHLAPLPVTVLTQARLGFDENGAEEGSQAATGWAQGGIAAAIGADDGPALHAADTEAAGAGLVNPEVARRVAEAAPACVEHLVQLGVPFDRAPDGLISLGLEAAHSRRRIAHAGGDGTGREVLRALVRAARSTPSIHIMEGARAMELVTRDGWVCGAWIIFEGKARFIPARGIILATGGLGSLYARTTNPAGATGSGIALAARAGAVLSDMEFVQFHPTAIVTAANGFAPMPLATEALRGEGAILVNARGERIMKDIPGAELAPRDVVARAVERSVAAGEAVFLDARAALGDRFAARFPSVAALCGAAGIDPAKQPIPVRAAAHYHMGGVQIDLLGRTNVAGLWACGEVSASGLHGANRLASNSLLEGLVFGRWIAEDIAGLQWPRGVLRVPGMPPRTFPSPMEGDDEGIAEIRQIMTSQVGVLRDRAGLTEAMVRVAALARRFGAIDSPVMRDGVGHFALTALFIAIAAQRRTESRGAHHRSDFPDASEEWKRSSEMTLSDALAMARDLQAVDNVIQQARMQ